MQKARLVAGAMLLVLVLLGASSSAAHASTLFDNGTFDSDLSSWTVGGSTPGNCLWDGSIGYPSAGSALLGTLSSCYIAPAGETWMASYAMDVNFDFHEPAYAGVRVTVMVGSGVVVYWLLPDCETWCSGSTGWFGVPGGNTVHVYFQNEGTVSGNIDTVSYDLGDSSLAPTPVPAATATPSTSPMSGSSAMALVTVSAATPAFDSGGTPVPLVYSASPSASSDITAGARMVAENHVWGFCLPSQLTQVFTSISVCLQIGTVYFPTWKFLGIDMVPYLAEIGVIAFFVFLLRQMQER